MLSKNLYDQMCLHSCVCLCVCVCVCVCVCACACTIYHVKSSEYPTTILVKIKHVKQEVVYSDVSAWFYVYAILLHPPCKIIQVSNKYIS